MSATAAQTGQPSRGSAASWTWVVLVPLVASCILAVRLAAAGTLLQDWHTNFAAASAEAGRLERPLLVHFYADWCVPCKKMEHEVLSRPALLQHLGTRFVGVKVNADQAPEIIKRFGIESVPTDVFVDPDGKVIAVHEGYQDPRQYLANLAKADAAFTQKWVARRPAVSKPAAPAEPPRRLISDRQPQAEQPQSSPPVAVPPGSEPAAIVEVESPTVGLSGFSPVALYHWRRWDKGDARFSWTHQGVEYRMASAAELTEFKESPARFAPRLLGCDPVVLWETDRAIPGDTRHGAYFDGELYLFLNPETRQRFRQNPMRFTRTRHVLLPQNAVTPTR